MKPKLYFIPGANGKMYLSIKQYGINMNNSFIFDKYKRFGTKERKAQIDTWYNWVKDIFSDYKVILDSWNL